jgi:hypothetical protein
MNANDYPLLIHFRVAAEVSGGQEVQSPDPVSEARRPQTSLVTDVARALAA